MAYGYHSQCVLISYGGNLYNNISPLISISFFFNSFLKHSCLTVTALLSSLWESSQLFVSTSSPLQPSSFPSTTLSSSVQSAVLVLLAALCIPYYSEVSIMYTKKGEIRQDNIHHGSDSRRRAFSSYKNAAATGPDVDPSGSTFLLIDDYWVFPGNFLLYVITGVNACDYLLVQQV